MGPADQDKEWQDTGVEGMWRFLQPAVAGRARGARARADRRRRAGTPLARKAHETIAKVTDDIERRFVFNTPVAAVMELVNELSRTPDDPASRFAAETAVSLIQPYAPHVGRGAVVACSATRGCGPSRGRSPTSRSSSATTIELVVQVNGKVRDRIRVPAGLPEEELIALAKASEKVQAHLNGKEPRAFVVPDKLVNFVV